MLVLCPLQKLLLLSLRPAPERTIKRSLTAKVATGRTGWCYKCPVALSRFPPYSLLPLVHVACCRGLTINESLAFLAARIMMITLPLSTPCFGHLRLATCLYIWTSIQTKSVQITNYSCTYFYISFPALHKHLPTPSPTSAFFSSHANALPIAWLQIYIARNGYISRKRDVHGYSVYTHIFDRLS